METTIFGLLMLHVVHGGMENHQQWNGNGRWTKQPDYPIDPPPNATLNNEFDPNFGNNLDQEYDQEYEHQGNMNPLQYDNHDYHHNSLNKFRHAPYVMHQPHGDYKNVHPGHPYEYKFEDTVTSHVKLDDDNDQTSNNQTRNSIEHTLLHEISTWNKARTNDTTELILLTRRTDEFNISSSRPMQFTNTMIPIKSRAPIIEINVMRTPDRKKDGSHQTM